MSSTYNSGRKHRILMVEDDPVHSRVVGKWLTAAGYEILAVDSFAGAIAALKGRWDAVLCDCDLPDGSGLEIARIAKLTYPRLPFILITAGQQAERVVQAVRYGIDDMMLKMAPLRREQLVARLAELIEATTEATPEPSETVLAIGAHPDDVEIGCGGALLQHVQNGHRVIILTMSHGAASGDEAVRSQEAHEAAKLLGAELILGNLPHTKLDEGGESIRLIQRTVDAYQPNRIYTHSVNDVHQDHRNIARASLSAICAAAQVACYQAPSATVDFRPTMFINIQRQLEQKLELIKAYRSQCQNAAHLAPEQIRANARYWSKYTSSEGAEPFEVIRSCA
ncbi:MAG: PIG-L family deacetylase [Kofleriaceae bacterium]|nr:PIG-L family deacetylase [Kofleriaceae bacterium]